MVRRIPPARKKANLRKIEAQAEKLEFENAVRKRE